MILFRSMTTAADGLPVTGPRARLLGVRPGNARLPDVPAVSPQDVVLPGQGGLSTAPDDPLHLLPHRRPPSLGGTGQDPVWCLETHDLPPELTIRQDKPTHVLIEPAYPMTLQEFQDALARTRTSWRLYCN